MAEQKQKWRSRIKRDLIIEVWEALDCESVGAHELAAIQRVIADAFGTADSPAAIARVVAEEGAVLRHPEVLDFDLRWRQQKLSAISYCDFSGLRAALATFAQIEIERHESDANYLKTLMRTAQLHCLEMGNSKILAGRQRDEANEIAEWIAVWLRTPDLFPEWLDLRMRSDEFRQKFPSE